MSTWAVRVLLGGVDVSARVAGRLWREQSASGSHLSRVTLIPASGTVDAGALVGQTLVWSVQIDGGAWVERYRGVVESADYDAGAVAIGIQASDDLQGLFEALTTDAAVLALVPGARLDVNAHGPWTDGWRRAQDALGTVPASVARCRDQVVRLTPWAAGSADVTLSTVDVWSGAVQVRRRARRERTNTCRVTVQTRGTILHHWELSSGFSLATTYCEWATADGAPDLVTLRMVDEAVRGAGALYAPGGALLATPGAGGGISYRLLPEAGTYYCPFAIAWGGAQGPEPYAVMGASWTWATQWAQTLTITYSLTVSAPASVAAYGANVRDDQGSLSAEDDYDDFGAAPAGGSLSRPAGMGTHAGGYRAIMLDAAAEASLIEAMLAEQAVAILDAHRDEVLIPCPPTAAALAVDMHHTVAATWERGQCTARVGGITEWWDLESWAVEIAILLRPSRCPGAGGTSSSLTAPTRPTITGGYTLPTSQETPVYIGGASDSDPYDGEWRGVTTNYHGNEYPQAGAPDPYPHRIALERPAVPDAARDEQTASASAAYVVYPPNDLLIETAP